MTPNGDITLILQRWDSDRPSAMEALTPIVYGELRKIAAAYLRRQRPGHTLQPTALINEAYLRLIRQEQANVQDRTHFYALAARMMRQVLHTSAEARQSAKRGSGNQVQLDDRMQIGERDKAMDFLAVHEAIGKLEIQSPRLAQAVVLRYFGGLQNDEIAAELGVSLATVKRDISLGEAWLSRALSAER